MTDSAALRFLSKVLRDGRSNAKWLIRQWMPHLQLGGVQHRPRRIPLSIEPVTCQGVADGGQMHADLMRAAGLELDGEQRAQRRCFERTNVRDGPLAVLADRELDRADARDRR